MSAEVATVTASNAESKETSTVETFLRKAEVSTEDPISKRLLSVATGEDPVGKLRTELLTVVDEIIHAA